MNQQGITGNNERADESGSVQGQPSVRRDGKAGPADQPLIPDYELLRRISGGAYGEVWLARSKATGVLRAAKIVSRRSFDDERPYQREFEGIQRFEKISREHPSQLALFHIGRNEAAGYFYYVMELADDVHGGQNVESYVPRTLRAELGQGRVPAAKALEIATVLTQALGHLHRNGLVHRNVKPSNVIFVNGRPKLADIGLVTDMSDNRSIVGTEGYLPPEGPGTPQADIFALGRVVYEAVTGLDRREYPKLPRDIGAWPDAKPAFELNEIVLRACATDAHARYGKVEDMLADLERLQQGHSVKRRRILQQRRVLARKAGVVMAVVALLAGAFVGVSHSFVARSERSDGGPSTNDMATALCARGMLIIRGDTYERYAEAYTNFVRAIKLDPRYARPYAGLLELKVREHSPNVIPMTERELREIAQALNQLAPESAAAHCAASILEFNDWDFPLAEDSSLKAIKADTSYELAHTWYAFMLTLWGRTEKARGQLKCSQDILPSKATIYRAMAHTYYADRDFTNAIKWYRKTLQWDPHHGIAYNYLGRAYLAQGDYTNAIENFKASTLLYTKNPSSVSNRFDHLLRAYNLGGARAYWQEEWRLAENNPNLGFYWKAVVQIHLGDTNSALSWLEKSYQTHERDDGFETPLTSLLFDECWDGPRDNPRFKGILQKIGFTRMMRSGGK